MGGSGGRVLVAGIGNVFFGDDGFGVEVVARLADAALPDRVDVADYGIRGVHLAYDLLDGRYGALVLVDAIPLDEAPGTLAVIEVDGRPDPIGPGIDAHAMNPGAVLAALASLGGSVARVLVVGCQPAAMDQGMQLSPAVRGAVGPAVELVADVARGEAVRLADAVHTPIEVG